MLNTLILNATVAIAILNIALGTLTCRADSWIQKPDFAGSERYFAIGFSIGTNGYIGTGAIFTPKKDFFEWNQTTNMWTQLIDLAVPGRYMGIGFSIGNKGYIGLGYANSNTYFNDFWEYNPGTNSWSQKADYPGNGRAYAIGFSIPGTGKGYAGTGQGSSALYNDFCEYDTTTNSWTAKAGFPGGTRYLAVGFGIGSKGYAGTGYDGSFHEDFYEYGPMNDTWTLKADYPGGQVRAAACFVIGSKGYVGTGRDVQGGPPFRKDFYAYDPMNNSWMQVSDFIGTGRYGTVGFSIGNKGYVGTGWDNTYMKDFYEYDPSSATGISMNQTSPAIEIYPNPSNGKFQIQAGGAMAPAVGNQYKIDIYNVLGEKVAPSQIPPSGGGGAFDFSSQPDGIYFINIRTAHANIVKKLIIK